MTKLNILFNLVQRHSFRFYLKGLFKSFRNVTLSDNTLSDFAFLKFV